MNDRGKKKKQVDYILLLRDIKKKKRVMSGVPIRNKVGTKFKMANLECL